MIFRVVLGLVLGLGILPAFAESHSTSKTAAASAVDEVSVGGGSIDQIEDDLIAERFRKYEARDPAIRLEDLLARDPALLRLVGQAGTGKTLAAQVIAHGPRGYLGFEIDGKHSEVLYDREAGAIYAARPGDLSFAQVVAEELRRALQRLGETKKAEDNGSDLAAAQKTLDDFEAGIALLDADTQKLAREVFYLANNIPLPEDGGRLERITELSGGQEQRVSLAHGLGSDMRVYVADEPEPGFVGGTRVEELRDKNGLKQFLIVIDGETRFRILAADPLEFPNGIAIVGSLSLFRDVVFAQTGQLIPEHTLAGMVVATGHIPVLVEDLDTGTRLELPEDNTAIGTIVASLPDASQSQFQAFFPFVR